MTKHKRIFSTAAAALASYQTRYKCDDKFNLGYVQHIYSQYFPDRASIANLLEIGAGGGESVRLWHDWYYNAHITCIDNGAQFDYTIKPLPWIFNQPRVTLYVGNAYGPLTNELPSNFDIIIDDGPHTLESFLYCAANYTHKLIPGGVLIIEDVIQPNWTDNIIANLPDRIVAEVIVHHYDGYNAIIVTRDVQPIVPAHT